MVWLRRVEYVESISWLDLFWMFAGFSSYLMAVFFGLIFFGKFNVLCSLW